jgi:DNA-binding transcriptional ArsR family regulator
MLILCDPAPMNNPSIARIASLVGEAGRIQMLTSLLSGTGHSASELALAAGVSPQTASSHLAKLMTGGLIVCERSGRHRVYRLKNAEVAVAIEALGALAPKSKTIAVPELRFARTCYDHLAGVLSIALRNELLKRDVLRHRGDTFLLTPVGERFLGTLDIDAAPLRELRRSFARKCLDWTERHPHIGGAVGAALLGCFRNKKWLAPLRGTRAVRLTIEGELAFERIFGINARALRSQSAPGLP